MAKSFLLLLTLALVGCSTISSQSPLPNTDGAKRALADENFLINSGNYPRLIELYKGDLKTNDTPSTRIKLAKAYIDTNDNESALFSLAPIVLSKNANSEVFYLQGLAQYNLGKVESANHSLAIAVEKTPNDAKAINLLGATQAELGLLKEARVSFNRARSLLYDDQVIKNNLALVDIMEGHYQDAAARLIPIYRADPSGVDKQLKANLAIISAKLGSFETLRALYGNQYSDEQLFGIFQGLRAATFVPSMSSSKGKDSRLLGKTNVQGEVSWQGHNQETQPPQPNLLDSEESPAIPASLTQPYNLLQTDMDADNVSMILEPQKTTMNDKAIDEAWPIEQPNSILSKPTALESKAEIAQLPTSSVRNTIQANSEQSVLLSKFTEAQEKRINSDDSRQFKQISNQQERETFQDLVGINRRYPGDKAVIQSNPVKDTSISEARLTRPIVMLPEYAVTMPSLPNPAALKNDALQITDDTAPMSNGTHLQQPIRTVLADTSPLADESSVENVLSPVRAPLAAPSASKKDWNFVILEQYSLVAEEGFSIPVAQFRHSGDLIDIH